MTERSTNLPKGSENAQMPKTDHTYISLAQDQGRITSVASHSLEDFYPKNSQPKLNNTADNYSDNPPRRSENAQMTKTGPTLISLAQNQNRITSTSVAPHSSKNLFSKISQSEMYHTTDKWTNHSKEPEKGFNRDNDTFNQLFKEKVDETTIKYPNFQTEHKKRQPTLIGTDSDLKQSEIIGRASDEFSKSTHARLSTDKTSELSIRTSLMVSHRNQNSIKDERVVHQPRNPYRSLKYLVGNQSGKISIASDSTEKFSSQIPRPNQDNTADNLVAHPLGEFENDPKPKFDRSPESLVCDNKGGIPTNQTDNLHEFHFQISRHNHGNIMEKEGFHLTRKFEKSAVREIDRTPHSLVDKNPDSDYSLSFSPTILQEVHKENPIPIQTFKTSSDKIVPRNTNSKLRNSDISNSTKNKSPENTSVKKTSESSLPYPLNSVKSKSSQNLSVRSTYNRPLSHPPNSPTRGKSLENMSVKKINDRFLSHLPNSSTRNRSPVSSSAKRTNERPLSQPNSSIKNKSSHGISIMRSLSLISLNRTQGNVITNTLYVPPEKIGGNPKPKSDQASLSFASSQRGIIFDASNGLSSRISRPNQINTIYKRIRIPNLLEDLKMVQ